MVCPSRTTGYEQHAAEARRLLAELVPALGADLVSAILGADQSGEAGLAAQRDRLAALKDRLASVDGILVAAAQRLLGIADELVATSF